MDLFIKPIRSIRIPLPPFCRAHTQLDVNGPNQHALFRFLKEAAPKDHGLPYDIRWNFGKFIVVNGQPVKRYAHDVSPDDMERDIVTYLRKAHTGEL